MLFTSSTRGVPFINMDYRAWKSEVSVSKFLKFGSHTSWQQYCCDIPGTNPNATSMPLVKFEGLGDPIGAKVASWRSNFFSIKISTKLEQVHLFMQEHEKRKPWPVIIPSKYQLAIIYTKCWLSLSHWDESILLSYHICIKSQQLITRITNVKGT